jgi:quinol monooxygenase YgiN
MTFFVAIYQEVLPDRVQGLLSTIRSSLTSARAAHPGRQRVRVFQRLGQPAHFLSLGEWESQAAFERDRASFSFLEADDASGPAASVEYFQRLHQFVRMEQRPAVVACATISAPAERRPDVEAFLRGAAQHDVVNTAGLTSRELYRSISTAGRLMVVHGWRSIADLERFRTSDVPLIETTLTRLGASVERFTGEITAQYSLGDRPVEP